MKLLNHLKLNIMDNYTKSHFVTDVAFSFKFIKEVKLNNHLKNQLLKKYPIGSKVKLLHMNDPYAPPIGSIGIVKGVDDLGSILIQWEDHGRLNILPEDIILLT